MSFSEQAEHEWYADFYEEIAANTVSRRNKFARKGASENLINLIEENAASALSKSKKERAWKASS